MSNKTRIEFDGFEETIARLNKLNGNVKNITEKALKKTHEIITQKAQDAITPHNETHQTERTLRKEAEIEWERYSCKCKNGF